MIDSTSNFIEHPELVAQRIVKYAECVGKENVIAGTDCGFDTFVDVGRRRPPHRPGQAGGAGRGSATGHRRAVAPTHPGSGMTPEPGARPRSGPRYLAVTEALRAEITAASPNTLLPTEQQLARRFGVSRLTLRRALGLLERSGLVSRQRGRGTTVSPPKISRLLAPLYTLEEDLRRQGLKLETRVLRYEPNTEPPEPIREQLQLRRRSRVAVVELLRLVDGQVIAHDRAYVPTPLAARFQPEEVGDPLLEVLRDRARVQLGRLEWEIEILPSGPEVAQALGITSGVLVVASYAAAYSRPGGAGLPKRAVLSHRPGEVPRCGARSGGHGGRREGAVPGARAATPGHSEGAMTERRTAERGRGAELDPGAQQLGALGPGRPAGTINLITPAKRVEAARLCRTGRSVSLSRPFPKEPGINNALPAQHFMRTMARGKGEPRSTTTASSTTASRPPTSTPSATRGTSAPCGTAGTRSGRSPSTAPPSARSSTGGRGS